MVDWTQAIEIEHKVAQIITQQEINGWKFDVAKAHEHVRWLDQKCDELYDQITKDLGYHTHNPKRTFKKPFSPQGGYAAGVMKMLRGDELPIAGPFTYIKPHLSEANWVKDQLLARGWVPDSYTDKGSPQLMVDGKPTESLLNMDDELGKNLSDWMTYDKRRGTILNRTDPTKGWLNLVREDGRITASANPCGTNTGRMRHSIVVNVPKAEDEVLFGKEMRELFTVEDGYVLVGHDASGLEARMFAHYMNDEELTYEIIHGDFHTKFWEPLKDFISSRPRAKNLEYAYLYGASNPKLGSMACWRPKGWSNERTGDAMRKVIEQGIPALGDLVDRVKRSAERGWLKGLDGRKLYVRSPHSALNTLFQGGGAVVMKKSIILLDEWCKNEGWTLDEVKKVGDFHDEGQHEVKKDEKIIELFSDFAVKSIQDAGKHFNLRCPLDAEAKVGMNWAETH